MYIIELITKLIKEKRKKPTAPQIPDALETCEHIFLPIDSTGEVLACSKCGFVVKKDDLTFKPRNPFT